MRLHRTRMITLGLYLFVFQASFLRTIIQATCNGCGSMEIAQTFSGGINGNIIVAGSRCFIVDGAEVSGSIEVSEGARLVIYGGTIVKKNILATGATTRVSLLSVATYGGVYMDGAGDLCIGANASIGQVDVVTSGDVRIEGSVFGVKVWRSHGDVMLMGATVLGGEVSSRTYIFERRHTLSIFRHHHTRHGCASSGNTLTLVRAGRQQVVA